MKKLLALLLAMVMVLSLLAGCGNKDNKKKDDKDDDKETTSETGDTKGSDETKGTEATKGNDETQGNTGNTGNTGNAGNNETAGVPVGTVLDKPEKTFDLEGCTQLHLTASIPDGDDTATVEIIMIDKGNENYEYYMAQGENAIALEISNGTMTGYSKEGGATSFTKDTAASQEELQSALMTIANIATTFADCTASFEGATYRKVAATATCPTGPAYAYEVMANDQVYATIYIDQATGMLVRMERDGDAMTVSQFKTTGVQMPAYK